MALAIMGISTGVAMHVQAGEETAATTMNNNKNMNMKADCSKLTKDEQDFANQLNDKNRTFFCSKFSASQRKASMMLSCSGPSNCGSNRASKKVLPPNDAVSKTASDNKISMDEKRESIAGEAKATVQ